MHQALHVVGVGANLVLDLLVDLTVIAINRTVVGADLAGQRRVILHQGVQAVAHHQLYFARHGSQAGGQRLARILRQIFGAPRDVDGFVRHAFEIVVDLQHGDHKTQVDSHRLVEGQHLEAVLLYLDLHLVHVIVALDHLEGQDRVVLHHRIDGLGDSFLYHSAQSQKLLLERLDFSQEVLRHEFSPSSASVRRDQPNRPVM